MRPRLAQVPAVTHRIRSAADRNVQAQGNDNPMTSNPASSYSVLVADDERDVVDTTADMLETCGCTVYRAYSAAEALGHLDDHPQIALVLSDIRMPEVDGFDLLRVIRYRFGKLSVVLMTGLPVTEEDHVPPGAAILTKPFTFDELKRVLPPRMQSVRR